VEAGRDHRAAAESKHQCFGAPPVMDEPAGRYEIGEDRSRL